MRLTDIAIRSLKAPEKGQITYTDDTLPGFGVRVSQGGTKTFVLVYGRTRRRATLGRYPLISLQDARSAAKTLLAERTLGRHVQTRSGRFRDARDAFLRECDQKIEEGRMKPRTRKDYERLLARHFDFGTEPMRDITPDDILQRISKLAATPSEQHHAHAVASIFFRWAKRKRYLAYNPLDGEEPPNQHVSRSRLLSPAEVTAIYRAADEHPFGTIVRLLILLGCRRTEAAHLQGEWIDRSERLVLFPSTVTKNKQENVVPYGDRAAAIFATLPSEGHLFPATRGHVRGRPTSVFNGWGKAKERLDHKCGVTDWWLHDTRRVFKSSLAALHVPDHISERLLGHISGISAMSRVYDRYAYLPEKREAMALWERHLSGLLNSE